jgi:hypothetical protein
VIGERLFRVQLEEQRAAAADTPVTDGLTGGAACCEARLSQEAGRSMCKEQ